MTTRTREQGSQVSEKKLSRPSSTATAERQRRERERRGRKLSRPRTATIGVRG